MDRARSLVKDGADRLRAAATRIDETLSEAESRRLREPAPGAKKG